MIGLPTNNLLEDRRTETSVVGVEGYRFVYHQTLWHNIVPWHHLYPNSDSIICVWGGSDLPSPSSSPLFLPLLSLLPSSSHSPFQFKEFLG